MNAVPQKYLAKSPYCDHTLDPTNAVDGWVTCECGHKSDVRWVSELGWLQTRANWVADRIKQSDAWFDSSRQQVPTPQKVHKPASGQQLLYILGGISMVVAVAVFTAVAWERIGAYGQLAALLAVVAIASFVAVKARKNLFGLSNTAAILATIVAGTGLLSAPYFGLIDESWSNRDSIYSTLILKLLVITSFAAGYLSRIPGWTYISIIGLAPTTMIFIENYVQANQTRPIYLLASMASLTVAAIAAALMAMISAKRHSVSNFFKISVTVVEMFFVFVMYTKAVESIEPSENPLLVSGGYLVIAAIWAVVALRIPRSTEGFLNNAVTSVAAYVSSVLVGFAISVACLPVVKSIPDTEKWYPIPGSANMSMIWSLSIGAVIMLAPILPFVRRLNLNRYLTITAAVVWYGTIELNNRLVFAEPVENSVTLFSFAIISLALTARWWKEIAIGFFIPAALFGSIAIGYWISTFVAPHFDGPEAVSLSVALYLGLMIHVLYLRTHELHNSFVVWGIPFSVALIPSALVANRLLVEENPTNLDWTRFWVVLAVSVVGLILGLRLQKSGLVIPGAIAFVVVALPQVFVRLAVFVPRWIIFGVIGILLITVAARFEHLQKLGRDTSRWFRKLN